MGRPEDDMGWLKCRSKAIALLVVSLFFMTGMTFSEKDGLTLTQEEKDYIADKTVLKAASIDGGAPLHYRNSRGEIKGIAICVLDEIAEKTGLIIEYELYDTIDEASNSESDILFGIASQYFIPGIILSHSYLKTEAILFMNSSLDPNYLAGKKYAGIKGGDLPKGVREKDAVFFDSREDTMNAVESGKADYGYGNIYSVAFYMLQNGYKNILSIPKGIEEREYSIGLLEDNPILLSIINKAIETIDEKKMQTLVLDMASEVDRKITLKMILNVYGRQVFAVIFLSLGILLASVIYNVRAKNRLRMQNIRYELLSRISNEYLYEYFARNHELKLSEKLIRLLGDKDNLEQAINTFEKKLLHMNLKKDDHIIRLPLGDGSIGVFKSIGSGIHDSKGKLYSIIGKLTDVSKEAAEKEVLITKSQSDGLTNLYNAATAEELIDKRLKAKAEYEMDALILIDCDKLKETNDEFGHLAGNQVLKNIGKGLKLAFRKTDIMGRIGGDEFCVYIKNIPSVDFVVSRCRDLSEIFRDMNSDFPFSVSIGVAFDDKKDTYEDLFKKADDALYRAKKSGRAYAVLNKEGYIECGKSEDIWQNV